jgi:hypothetical protein
MKQTLSYQLHEAKEGLTDASIQRVIAVRTEHPPRKMCPLKVRFLNPVAGKSKAKRRAPPFCAKAFEKLVLK